LTIAVALSTLVLAATILAWLSHTPPRHRAAISQTARRGGRIAHATIHTSNDATVRQEADHHATISHTQLRTDGATIHQYADNATITDTHINATDHTHTHNP
jgi:hypothetical protein